MKTVHLRSYSRYFANKSGTVQNFVHVVENILMVLLDMHSADKKNKKILSTLEYSNQVRIQHGRIIMI